MAQIPSSQGAPQFSNIAAQDALPLIGSLSRENGQTVLNYIDAELAKLFEDRNILLAEGGTITWSTTTNNLTFSASLKLHINSQIAGGSPTVIDLTSTTRAFSADNRMLYAVINRIAGTATVTADATTLPSVVAANIEVVLLAKRISGQIYFRNGFTLANGQTAVLGRHGSVIDTEFVINDSTDPTKQLAFDAAGTTGTKTTVVSSQTTNRTLTLPDATDILVGKATTDSLSNKQVAYSSSTDSSTTGSNTTLASFTSGVVRLTNASLVSLSGIPGGTTGLSVIIENKTGNSIVVNNEEATATAANRIQTGTNGNISMANNASFLFVYDATTSRWQLVGGTGSGSGSGSGKNYLSAITTSQSSTPNTGNGDFSSGSTTGWSLGTVGTLTNNIPTGTPTFGSGASGNLSISTVSSGQLAGSYSLSYASSAATTQGNMLASDAFYIDTEDQAKVLSFKFYYKAQTNPTNGNFSGTNSNSFAIAAWDVTNSAWLPLTGNFSMTQNSGVGIASGTFQTASNTTQLRFVVYNANASAGAITMYFDDFFVGPQIIPQGAVTTDWQVYTPTVAGQGSATFSFNTAYWRRVGDDLELRGFLATNAAGSGASNLTLSLPSGLVMDTAKISASSPTVLPGYGTISNPNNTFIMPSGASTTTIFFYKNGTALQVLTGSDLTSSTSIEWAIKVPITGWSSNVQMSSDTDTRVVALSANASGTTTIAASSVDTKINYNTAIRDTHGAFSTSTNTYTIPVTGWYKVRASVRFDTASWTQGDRHDMLLYKNGGSSGYINSWLVPYTGSYYPGSLDGERTDYYNAGDTIDIRVRQPAGTTRNILADSSINYLMIERLSGPSVIAASETVAVRYSSSSGQSIAASTDDVFKPTTKEIDTHGAFNTSTGIFTVPVSGLYSLNGLVTFNDFGGSNGSSVYMKAFGAVGVFTWTVTGISAKWGCGVNRTARLKAGDQISFTISQFTGAGKALVTDANFNYIDIVRVGN